MVLHPWERATYLAATIGLVMGALGISIGGFSLNKPYLTPLFVTLGVIAFISLSIILIILFALAIRDYIELYPKFNRKLFGIRWLRY